MSVATKKVTERREVHYDSFDELLADAERLANGNVKTVGNWTLGQIFKHLAQTMHSSIDGTDMKLPWLMKQFFRLFMNKEKMLSKPVPPGYKIPKQGEAQFSPDRGISTEDGLTSLRTAIERYRTEPSRAEHPAFGQLTGEEWDKLNLRHAELHMSFAILA